MVGQSIHLHANLDMRRLIGDQQQRARLVGWVDFLHDCASETGVSARCERAMGHETRVVWKPVQNFLAQQKPKAQFV